MLWTPALAIAGAVLALGPIIIHLLFRRRYRIIDFAAMRFLLDSMRRNRSRLRLEELLIIALRVAACLLIGLMLANIRSAIALPGTHAPTAHVFILDDSLSMGQRAGTSSLFQRATQQLADQLGKLPDNDLVAVLSATQPEGGKPLDHLALAGDLKRDHFPRRLAALKPGDLRAKFPAALDAARELLHQQKDMPGRICVVSDFRRLDFTAGEAVEPLRKAFATATDDGHTELVLLDYGLPCKDNLTLEELRLLDRLAVAGVGSQLQLSVRNNSSAAARGATITLQLGEATLPVITLPELAPGETVRRTVPYVFPKAGVAWVRASLGGDALPGDDSAALALPVYEALRVLIVDGSPDPASIVSSSICLAQALDPSGQGAFGQKVEIVAPKDLRESDLDASDAVLLTNVRELLPTQLEALERYVRAGGGLGIFVGDQVNLEFYNGPLFAGGAGLSPFRLKDAGLPLVEPKTFVRLRPDRMADDPMLRIFAGPGAAFTQLIRFHGYLHADEQSARAEVLARFGDNENSPAVARRSFGKGNAIMWYTSSDTRWSDWPKERCFLPVINDMIWQLARSRTEGFTGPLGEPIRWTIPAALADATAIALKTPAYPAEDMQVLQPQGSGKQRRVEYAATRHAGLYAMEFTLPNQTQQTVWFARGIDPAEGDLAKADEKEIAATVGVAHSYRGTPGEAIETAGRRSYWWVFLAMLLVVLGLEVFLAQKFGHYAET